MPEAARRRHSDDRRKAEAVLRQRPPHLRPQGSADDKNARAGVGVIYRTPEAIFVTAARLFSAFRVNGTPRNACARQAQARQGAVPLLRRRKLIVQVLPPVVPDDLL